MEEFTGVGEVTCQPRSNVEFECKLDLGQDKSLIQRVFGYKDEEAYVTEVKRNGNDITEQTLEGSLELDDATVRVEDKSLLIE